MVNTDVFTIPCHLLVLDGDSYLSPPWAQVLGFSVDFSLFHSSSSASTGLEEVCPQDKRKENRLRKRVCLS